MKNLKNAAKLIAWTAILSTVMNMTAQASHLEIVTDSTQYKKEVKDSLNVESKIENMAIEIESLDLVFCEISELIIVLGEDDEIVYRGSQQLEDVNNAFLTRLLTKADFIMSSRGKSFYKVF